MAITLTERAARKIRQVFTRNGLDETACLRIAVKAGACGDNAYVLDVVRDPAPGDRVFESRDIRIVCDPEGCVRLDGTEVDYDDAVLQGGFKFHNPNAKEISACGVTFLT
jgi:iron-sulfur cluster assembly protein